MCKFMSVSVPNDFTEIERRKGRLLIYSLFYSFHDCPQLETLAMMFVREHERAEALCAELAKERP